jgi:valyl-tRNA synthetase
LNGIIATATKCFEQYDYATARSEIEAFFWRDLADNYLEMAKRRLYDSGEGYEAARYTLHAALLATLKLLAPFLPYVTESIFRELFAETEGAVSIHWAQWPRPDNRHDDEGASAVGEALLNIATAVRRFKSERNLPLGVELAELRLAAADPGLRDALRDAATDLLSITRAGIVTIAAEANGAGELIAEEPVTVRVIL